MTLNEVNCYSEKNRSTKYMIYNKLIFLYHKAGKFGGGKFGELTLFEPLAKESLVN